MPEVNKNPAKIFVVFFDPVIELFDIRPGYKPQNVFFKLAGPFSGDYLNKRNLFIDCIVNNTI